MTGSWVIRATLNLNAATCFVLLYVPLPELRSMLPDLLTLVETSLQPSDPRRRDVERIARNILTASPSDVDRRRLATAVRAAYSFQETQIIRLRSFRNIILGTSPQWLPSPWGSPSSHCSGLTSCRSVPHP
jgi:hypothetical protein